MSGFSHVCRNEMAFHRWKRVRTFRRFDRRFSWVPCGPSASSACARRCDGRSLTRSPYVANAGTAVSPRSSPPSPLLFRRRRTAPLSSGMLPLICGRCGAPFGGVRVRAGNGSAMTDQALKESNTRRAGQDGMHARVGRKGNGRETMDAGLKESRGKPATRSSHGRQTQGLGGSRGRHNVAGRKAVMVIEGRVGKHWARSH